MDALRTIKAMRRERLGMNDGVKAPGKKVKYNIRTKPCQASPKMPTVCAQDTTGSTHRMIQHPTKTVSFKPNMNPVVSSSNKASNKASIQTSIQTPKQAYRRRLPDSFHVNDLDKHKYEELLHSHTSVDSISLSTFTPFSSWGSLCSSGTSQAIKETTTSPVPYPPKATSDISESESKDNLIKMMEEWISEKERAAMSTFKLM